MLAIAIKTTILETAHILWHLYNRLLFWMICLYYQISSAHEQHANRISDTRSSANTEAPKQATKQRNPISYNDVAIRDLRIPKHIAMSFTNEANDLDLDSIAKLLFWCKQLGVEQITLYDDLGKLKNNQKQLIKHVEFKMRSIGSEKPIDGIHGLNILSRCDGRQKFVYDVRDLLKEVEQEKIDLNLVQEHVGWTCDPELLISFGQPLCLYGFPPWQLRLTEILSIPTHKRVPQKVFLDCLAIYSRISQREGT